MEFLLLGPLTVRHGRDVVPVRPGKQRMVLAALLLRANHLVAMDELAEVLWDGARPPSARVTTQNYVKRLRQALADGDRSRISTEPHGYRIWVDADELDLSRFKDLLTAAQAAARDGSWEAASARACTALALWRGDPLEDVQSDLLRRRDVPRLNELRLQAQETRFDAELHLGRHTELVDELRQLTSTYPLRERFWALLMLALYHSGRQADALAAYQRARNALVEELGAEPGAELRSVQQRVLNGDAHAEDQAQPPAPAVAGGPRPRAGGEPGANRIPVPQQLPAPVRGFTGRAAELGQLSRLLDGSPGDGLGMVLISAIGGTAGVGKTALAVHWAHQSAAHFPDGQLYVNLRGYDPGQPVPPADALAGFLRSLGVPGQDIPPEEDDRATRYRSLLVGKRMLIVLDNAGSAAQVRPLLPGTPTCTVLVTSRDALAGLVALDGATRLDLDMLPAQDAVALLRALIGARVDAEPGAAGELAGLCCRLPLALRVAADLAVSRPDVSLAGLAAELGNRGARLDLLAADDDPRAQVRTVFSWSYRHLDPDDARTFRLLGLHPGPDFEPYAVAALTGSTVPQSRQTLELLARAHLIQPTETGRYGMHDLLRGYARELSIAQDAKEDQHAALTGLFDHYLHTATEAADTLFPAQHHGRPRISPPATVAPPPADGAAAREWLDRERVALVAAAGYTAAHGWPGHATRLAVAISNYLYGDHFPEAVTVFSHALTAARSAGDRIAEAEALSGIGYIDWSQGRLQQACGLHRSALALFREAGDRAGEADALGKLGMDELHLGHYVQAAQHQQEAAIIFRDVGDRFGEACALGNLGVTRQRQGHYQEAAGYYQQSLNLFREIGDRGFEAIALARLGVNDLRLGSYQRAAGYLEQALALKQETGNRSGQAEIMSYLATAYTELSRHAQAIGNLNQALTLSREAGLPVIEAQALNAMGEVLFRTGEADQARAHHAAALRLASEIGLPLEQGRAHSGLARLYQADGDSLHARHHWQEALTCYTTIGAPEADEIRAQLASAGDDGDEDRKPTEDDGDPQPAPRA